MISDQGREFVNNVKTELFSLTDLSIETHLQTDEGSLNSSTIPIIH